MRTLELDDIDPIFGHELLELQHEELINAIDLASDQDEGTWITRNGKRVAAIVTVEDAEYLDRRLAIARYLDKRLITAARAGSELFDEYGDVNDILSNTQKAALDLVAKEREKDDARQGDDGNSA